MTKTNQQKIDEQLVKCFKVVDLKRILNNLPDDMPIGRVGYFGECILMEEDDISVRDCFITPNMGNWRDHNRRQIKVLDFISPDIGDAPD